jgi:hypothetical protein
MSQLQFISKVIYRLKKEYGLPLELYSITDIQIDLETGIKQLTKQIYKIKKAILLPRRMFSETVILLGGSRQFQDKLDKQKRQIIIDVKDYPKDYIVRPKDYIIIQHERFNIIEAELYDNKLAVVLTVTKIIGEQPAAVINASVKDTLDINQGVENG